MKPEQDYVLTGTHFFKGNDAVCEGAITAGCRFVAGYPITPSTGIIERIALRFPFVGGAFIQMEDELSSSIAIAGAVWAGSKAMTVTSGPGFSLMMENIGFAAMTETPCVFVNVQRGGPSTGLPTLPGQADMMQARWGSHGDYAIIALSPDSPQECYNLIIQAFNFSEQFRVPVMFMMDECVAHMSERVVIPPAEEIDIFPRRYTTQPPETFELFRPGPDLVPDMVKAGDGYHVHITGLTHDEKGYPEITPECQAELIPRLINKIRFNEKKIRIVQRDIPENAEVVVVSYGITSRIVTRAVDMARAEGINAGVLRLIVVWPFPEEVIRGLAGRTKAFVVAEMNYGQVSLEVERCAAGKARVSNVPHAGGTVHEPEQILSAIREAMR
ncbi:MAG: 2-oxoacid:acceptor oxidoreductase subunit alpha [Candidatus Sumerlaeota bacterium]|nr:2-oxoacid:acceptor oxidoreductase subunit alpha [Candidatus Sumerlaeota bacterium]